jgi:hypothetical protein
MKEHRPVREKKVSIVFIEPEAQRSTRFKYGTWILVVQWSLGTIYAIETHIC